MCIRDSLRTSSGFFLADNGSYSGAVEQIVDEYAEKLIKEGKAYVDDLSREEMREYRGADAVDVLDVYKRQGYNHSHTDTKKDRAKDE